MRAYSILFVDDDEKLLALLQEYFAQEQFAVSVAKDGRKALDMLDDVKPDIMVLDIMMPGMSGLEVCREVRRSAVHGRLPIIMLTARAEEPDRFVGLEMGADDYLVKPFSMRELGARIRAILRRMDPLRGAERPESGQEIVRDGLVLQIREHTLVKDGQPVALTPTEFSLLQLFMKHPGQVFNRMQLLESTHGEAFDGYERTIDAHIRNLRRKIDEEPGMSRIETVYGIGYRFRGGM